MKIEKKNFTYLERVSWKKEMGGTEDCQLAGELERTRRLLR